jgi:polysaccharide deacetylase family protein (PEP-CTERM system associated)
VTAIVNALSVDVEDYFQVSAFDEVVSRAKWDGFESRVDGNTRRLLEMFDRHGVKATFFMLGWVAERHPDLVVEIHRRGHEVASHGYAHRMITQSSPAEFRQEIRQTKAALEDMIQAPVIGFRAPSFSITQQTEWALEILAEEGFRYDSSIFPIRHDRYGIPRAERFPYVIRYGERALHEFPMSTVDVFGLTNLPVSGGGYLRWLPLWTTRWGIRRINEHDRRPAVLYLHPWEIDVDQPRIRAGLRSRLRHYRNLKTTTPRLAALLTSFRWDTVRAVLGLPGDGTLSPAHAHEHLSDRAVPVEPHARPSAVPTG